MVKLFPYAAIATDPPCRLVGTGEQAGPLCLRPLNQKAVNQTVVPGALLLANCTSSLDRPVLHSNFHADRSLGGVAPTKLNTDAPLALGGIPRQALDPESRSLIVTVQPNTPTTFNAGADTGGGIGVGDDRTVNPSVIFCASLTLCCP